MVTLRALRRDLPINPTTSVQPGQGIQALGAWWETMCVHVDAHGEARASSHTDGEVTDQIFRSGLEQERVIAEAILSRPATTMAELAIKARVLARAHGA